MKNIIFIAPPAAGKGTVSEYLVKNNNYEHLSTGDLLRSEAKSGSVLGKQIDDIISKGLLVSDDIMVELVKSKLEKFDRSVPFILDGFPRTLNQAKKLDEMLISLDVTNNVVIYLDIDKDLALKRVLGRVNCPECKRTYNVYFDTMKPTNDGVCDDCGSKLVSRSDDNEESFKVRFDTYLENAKDILNFYRDKGLLKEIKVDNDLDRVLNQVKEVAND